MNRILLTTLALGLVFSSSAYARNIDVGATEVFGDASIDNTNGKVSAGTYEEKTKSTSINLGGFYYIQQNLGLGGIITYDKSNTSYNTGAADDSSKTFLLSPAAGYNISIAPDASIGILLALAGAIVGDSSYQFGNNPEQKSSISGTMFIVAYRKFFNPNVSLNVSLVNSSLKSKPDGGGTDTKFTSTAINAGLSVFFNPGM